MALPRWNKKINWISIGLCCLAFCVLSPSGTYAQQNTCCDDRPLLEVNPPPVPADGAPVAIVGCRLIDGLGGEPVEDAVVVVERNRIVDAGPRAEVEIPDHADRLDAAGKTLMPGLIDAHFHSLMDNDRINRYLHKGITTMRDPGHPLRFYQSLHFAEKPVPRMFLTGGHLEGFPPVWESQAVVVRNHAHARQAVYDHVENGATGIKLYFKLPLDYYEVIMDAASKRNVPVMAHLELVDADDAIRAGLEGVEHVTSFGTALAGPKESRTFKKRVNAEYGARREERFRLWSTIDVESDRVQEVIELAVENDVIMTPTLSVFERYQGDEGVKDFHVKGYRNMVRFVEKAYRSGMRIALGSHASVPHADSGWDYQHEMELLVNEVGMDPMDVITSSTMGNARYFRTEQRLGSIEAGKLADLLLIEGRPDEDIAAMKNIGRVMLNGTWIEAGD
ncbi:Imidazolonepropionase [Fodinibius roseus]|uniref:Imidazolonepropionase n=1 Tax=Fodinibius roseus TaxID=1194090 RepID=A0A1M4V6D4_9BACT|nr:amidohydrolase family protein [Fodinibius roseus]SHE64546.1 Imidazolonepropionase [Fodinibius roseus]